jgi:hypothetical protein
VTAKNEAIARRLADQSARGSSTRSTTDLVSMPPWAYLRNCCSNFGRGLLSRVKGRVLPAAQRFLRKLN